MENCMNMSGMGWMMGGGALIGALVIVLLVVGIAAGVKYLRSGRASPPAPVRPSDQP